MKPLLLVSALLLASLAQADPTVWQTFRHGKSPNGKLAVAIGWSSIKSNDPKNYLIKIETSKIVATLARSETWPGGESITVFARDREGDPLNGIETRWSADSKLVAVLDQSKKGTNAVDLVTANGKRLRLLQKIQENAAAFLTKKSASKFAAARRDVIYTCHARQISSTQLTVDVSAWVHAGEHQDFSDNITLTYKLRTTSLGITITGSSARQGKEDGT